MAATPAPGAKSQKVAILLIVGGLLLVVGTLLPFAKVELSIPGIQETSETSGGLDTDDGKVFLGLGIALVLFGGIVWAASGSALRRTFSIISLLLGAFSLLAVIIDITGSEEALLEELGIASADLAGLEYSNGIGLYVVLVGSVLAVLGALLGTFARKSPEGGVPAYAAAPPAPGGPEATTAAAPAQPTSEPPPGTSPPAT